MATYIYIPKNYRISGESELTETLSSPLTDKSAVLSNKTVVTSVSGYICAFGSGSNLLGGGQASAVLDNTNAWVSESQSDTATLDGNVAHMAPCDRYSFPDLENSDWEPAELNKSVIFHNNTTERGNFRGRSVVREGRRITVRPLTFYTPKERVAQLYEMARAMQTKPFYVQIRAPEAGYVYYGWLVTGSLKIAHTSDYGQTSLSFDMEIAQ